jgi:hypothetical protein
MTHNVTKLPQVKYNKSHVEHILLSMCQICLTIFLTHGVPNTPQVKPTEDNCEAYFTQRVKCDFVPVSDLQCRRRQSLNGSRICKHIL